MRMVWETNGYVQGGTAMHGKHSALILTTDEGRENV